ncbi:MAG: ABC transporter ATP-binding protein, partial [Phycisphaerae bacterium]|nr:ABC transporter ATP-binding protein [Phycisphaerae bacterium]
MLQARQICKEYGTTKVVNGLDLSVESGQICGLLGPNGAGKSTSIRMICGVLAPTSGSINIAGFDIAKKPSQAKQVIGYVPEGAPLPLEMLPVEFLKTTASMYGITGKQKMD